MNNLTNVSAATKGNEMFNSEVQIKLSTGELLKPAYADDFNRLIDKKRVNSLLEAMKVKGYRKNEPIQVIKAEEAIKLLRKENENAELKDINGKVIPESRYNEYALVVEGQHRTLAASKYSTWLSKAEPESKLVEIPAVEVELINESIMQYISEINRTKKEWLPVDYLNSAATINSGEPLLQRFKELMKDDFPLSTLNLIYGTKLNSTGFQLLCEGKKTRGVVKTYEIIPKKVDIETGDFFINICKKVGFPFSDIKKRYLITEFNNLKDDFNKEERKTIFESITGEDILAMKNEKGNLDESHILSQIELVVVRHKEQQYNSQQLAMVASN